jgi:secreted trypsin-like serine protease
MRNLSAKILVCSYLAIGCSSSGVTPDKNAWQESDESATSRSLDDDEFENLGITGQRIGRVIGGVLAEPNEFPFLVGLLASRSVASLYCGGTLIGPSWVVTAAHCLKPSMPRFILIGTNSLLKGKGKMFAIKRSIVHGQFSTVNMENDVALIELKKPVSIAAVKPARLAWQLPQEQDMLTVAGWGFTEENGGKLSSELRKADVPYISRTKCNSTDFYFNSVGPTNFCAGYKEGGKDTCQGDSGGPILKKEYGGQYSLLGLTSWGEGCARKNKPGVYTDLILMKDWIKQNSQITNL